MTIKNITVENLYTLQKKSENLLIVDVRTPEEYKEYHIPGAILIPLYELTLQKVKSIVKFMDSKETSIYVTCASGPRAEKACQILMHAGFPNVFMIQGCTNAWIQAGFAINRGNLNNSLPTPQQV
jgi:rhodanese-related sulfurtransferase